jgi:hypothetical protein
MTNSHLTSSRRIVVDMCCPVQQKSYSSRRRTRPAGQGFRLAPPIQCSCSSPHTHTVLDDGDGDGDGDRDDGGSLAAAPRIFYGHAPLLEQQQPHSHYCATSKGVCLLALAAAPGQARSGSSQGRSYTTSTACKCIKKMQNLQNLVKFNQHT